MKLVCIPATVTHMKYVEYSIERLLHILPHADFLIVTPNPIDYHHLIQNKISIQADFFYADFSPLDIMEKLGDERKPMYKWFYQQMLKYSILSKVIGYEEVLIVDADTIIVNNFVNESNFIYTTSLEYNKSYFNIIVKYFPNIEILHSSAIVNFMWFNKLLFDQMISEIEDGKNKKWHDIIIKDIVNSCDLFSFSEYETYANYRYNICKSDLKKLKVFRRADLFLDYYDFKRIVEIAGTWSFDVISFEQNHKNSIIKKCSVFLMFLLIEIRSCFQKLLRF